MSIGPVGLLIGNCSTGCVTISSNGNLGCGERNGGYRAGSIG